MEKSDWQRSKEQQNSLLTKMDLKEEWKGVRHAQKKRFREGERESKGKNNEKIESYIVRQNKKARKTLMQKESKKVIEWKHVKMMQRRGTRLRGNEKMSNRNLGVYSDIKVLKDRDFINQSKLSIILYKQDNIVIIPWYVKLGEEAQIQT